MLKPARIIKTLETFWIRGQCLKQTTLTPKMITLTIEPMRLCKRLLKALIRVKATWWTTFKSLLAIGPTGAIIAKSCHPEAQALWQMISISHQTSVCQIWMACSVTWLIALMSWRTRMPHHNQDRSRPWRFHQSWRTETKDLSKIYRIIQAEAVCQTASTREMTNSQIKESTLDHWGSILTHTEVIPSKFQRPSLSRP